MLVFLHSLFSQWKEIGSSQIKGTCMPLMHKHSTSSLTFIKATIFTFKCGMHFSGLQLTIWNCWNWKDLAEKPRVVLWSHHSVTRSPITVQGGTSVLIRKLFSHENEEQTIYWTCKGQINLKSSSINISLV